MFIQWLLLLLLLMVSLLENFGSSAYADMTGIGPEAISLRLNFLRPASVQTEIKKSD